MTEKAQSRYLANEMLNRDDADPDDYLAILSRQLLCADECIVELERQLAEARKALDEVWEVASGEKQVAMDDTQGMEWITDYLSALEFINTPAPPKEQP